VRSASQVVVRGRNASVTRIAATRKIATAIQNERKIRRKRLFMPELLPETRRLEFPRLLARTGKDIAYSTNGLDVFVAFGVA
jgi:hypothetical protein